MEKVKVVRYTSGKRPAYAEHSSDSEESDSEEERENNTKQSLLNIDVTSAQERYSNYKE